MSQCSRFIDALLRAGVFDRACNQYACGDRASAIRSNNLALYFEEVGAPKMLLIGEAPSHRGGRLTGIAFTIETLMLSGVNGHL